MKNKILFRIFIAALALIVGGCSPVNESTPTPGSGSVSTQAAQAHTPLPAASTSATALAPTPPPTSSDNAEQAKTTGNPAAQQTEQPPQAASDLAYDLKLIFPSDKYPETALHIHGAIEQGASAICTIDRAGADANRRASLAGVDTKNGYDRDEWPMAMCKEGGKGASVAYIDASDNRGAGSWIGNQLSDYPDGTRVLFVVDKPKVLFPDQSPKPSASTKSASDSSPKPSPSPPTTAKEEESETVFYANCAAVRAAGKAPLYKGDPGYSAKLDRDKDGIACE